MPKSELLFFFELFFIIGVIIASIFYIFNVSFYYLFILAVFYFLALFLKQRLRLFLIFSLSSLIFGAFYFSLYASWHKSQDYFSKNIGETFSAKLKIISQPYQTDFYQKFFAAFLDKKGKIIVFAKKDISLNYGDVIFVKGKILPLKGNYYFKDNVFSQIKPYQIKILASNQGNFLLSLLYKIKNSFQQKISQIFSPTEASFYNGLLFGSKENMPKPFLEKLKKSGTIHLIALSGYNISIISVYLLSFFIFLGFKRGAAFYPAVFGIFLFVLMTGASKSCLRAAIMGSLYLLAQKIGSLPTPKYILALAAFLMALANPKIILFDIGFQLSFLATIGLFYLFEPIKQKTFLFLKTKFKKIYFSWQNLPILDEFFITLSAQFSVAPLLLFYFGYLPIAGIISNILILPFIPLVMLFSFLVALFGFLSQKLAFVLALFLKPFWLYFKFLVDIGSKFVFKPNILAFVLFFIFYFFTLYFIIKSQQKNAKIF